MREAIGTAQGEDQVVFTPPLTSSAPHINLWYHLPNTENLREPHIDLKSVRAWLLSVLDRVMMICYFDFLSEKWRCFLRQCAVWCGGDGRRFPKQRWMLIGKRVSMLDRNAPRSS